MTLEDWVAEHLPKNRWVLLNVILDDISDRFMKIDQRLTALEDEMFKEKRT